MDTNLGRKEKEPRITRIKRMGDSQQVDLSLLPLRYLRFLLYIILLTEDSEDAGISAFLRHLSRRSLGEGGFVIRHSAFVIFIRAY